MNLLTQVGDTVTATSDPTGTNETMCLCLVMLTDCLKCLAGIFQVQVKLNRQHLWSNVDLKKKKKRLLWGTNIGSDWGQIFWSFKSRKMQQIIFKALSWFFFCWSKPLCYLSFKITILKCICGFRHYLVVTWVVQFLMTSHSRFVSDFIHAWSNQVDTHIV